MPLTQQTFLGSSISSFSVNLGWNSQTSNLSVNLVSDPLNGDFFNPPIIGAPVFFAYDSFEYGGILQAWEESNSQGGSPLYRVTVTDPKEIMVGTQCIIDNYIGSVNSTPNLINCYGFLEDEDFGGGFGNAEVNEGGMPWNKFKDAIQVLTSAIPSIAPQYGGPLNFRGYNYKIDLSELPLAPDYYRIGGGVNIGLMDVIDQFLQEAGHDYYTKLVSTSVGNIIKFKTVSRKTVPPLGQIAAFIGNGDGTISNIKGQELRNEVTSAFVVGGDINALFLAAGAPSGDATVTPADNPIWSYWGLLSNGIPILANNPLVPNTLTEDFESDLHTFNLNSTQWNVAGIGNSYPCDVGEMRAALASEPSWVSYVAALNPAKAQQMGISPQFNILPNFLKFLQQGNGVSRDFYDLILKQAGGIVKNTQARLDNIHLAYNYVRNVAENFYGIQFMVRIPQMEVAQETDTLRMVLSHEPSDGGWVDEGEEPLGLPALFQDLFRLSDRRYQAFARFDNASSLNFSNLSLDDYLVWNNILYVKCDVDPLVYFMDLVDFTNPRGVISLPGRITRKFQVQNGVGKREAGILKLFARKLRDNNSADPLLDPTTGELTTDAKTSTMEQIRRHSGGYANFGYDEIAVGPDYVAFPLRSNLYTYGPWYIIGPPGQTHFEQDESLVPWNYDGYEFMNRAGRQKIQEFVTNMQVGELGTVQIDGVPTIQIGDVLKLGGPNITGVDVEVGSQGVTTTYTMRTYTPKYGSFSKHQADKLHHMMTNHQNLRRTVRQVYRQQFLKKARTKQF